MKKKTLFCILSVVCLCSLSHANLTIKIVAEETSLMDGDSTTLHVYGWDDALSAGEGLKSWQCDVLASSSDGGGVSVLSYELMGPAPVDLTFSFPPTLDSPDSGSIDNINALIQSTETASDAGVGVDSDPANAANYTELFNFTVQASTSSGTVEYSLENLVAATFGTLTYTDANVTLYSADALNMVPEPSSLLILSGLSALGYFRRKRGR